MSNLPQQQTIKQYVADGTASVFTYPYLIIQNADTTYSIEVYVTLAGLTANPDVDLQPQGTAYTVQGAGNTSGGTITFQAGFIPPLGAIVTLTRAVMNAIDTQFAVAQYLNGANLDSAFLLLMLCVQQNTSQIDQSTLHYPINAYLPSADDNEVPVLTNLNDQIWISQNGKIIAALLEKNVDYSTLRSQLASEVQGADGSRLVGYFSKIGNVAQTVGTALDTLFDTTIYGMDSSTTANSVTVTIPGTISFFNGQRFYVRIANANSGDTTLSMNGTSMMVRNQDYTVNNVAIAANQLVPGMIAQFVYEGGIAVLLNPNTIFYGAQYFTNASAMIAAGGTTQILFNSVIFDSQVLGMNGGFTIKKAGYYRLGCMLQINPGAFSASSGDLMLYKNGAVLVNLASVAQQSTTFSLIGGYTDKSVVNDTYAIYYQNNSANVNDLVPGPGNSSFTIQYSGA